MTTMGSPRRQDLDLMRAAVVGGLIFFHTARIFDPLDFYVKDQPPNLALTLFVLFAGLWGMPLLFVVSGLGAWYSLRSRTATGFIQERLARLLVPFLVGLLLVVPHRSTTSSALNTKIPAPTGSSTGTSSSSTSV
jgi:glucans biosynthesis protein C